MHAVVRNREHLEQEVLIKTWQGLTNYKDEGKLKQWIRQITANTCRDYFRSAFFRLDKLIDNDSFKPWQPDIERNPLHWKEKKKISVSDEISFNNIEDICNLFDADFNKTKRGFLRRGGILHPKNNGTLLWWPSERTRQGWINKLRNDEQEIIETHEEAHKREQHLS